MSFDLFAAVVPQYRRMLGNLQNLIDAASAQIGELGLAEADIVGARLIEDMLPFAYQVKSVAVHSFGAIEGVRRGTFSPDLSEPGARFADFAAQIAAADAGLATVTADELNALVGQPMQFVFRNYVADFTADTFLVSFSVPNFYFHLTTAYDLLRMKGVKVGKRDYLGAMAFRPQ